MEASCVFIYVYEMGCINLYNDGPPFHVSKVHRYSFRKSAEAYSTPVCTVMEASWLP